jgi:hypothetical protein
LYLSLNIIILTESRSSLWGSSCFFIDCELGFSNTSGGVWHSHVGVWYSSSNIFVVVSGGSGSNISLEHTSGSVEDSFSWLNEMSIISPGDTGWGDMSDVTSGEWEWGSGVSWELLSEGVLEGVVIVSWVSSIGVVNTSGSGMVPSINFSNTTTVGKSILEWLVWSSILLVFPSWVEISLWSISLPTDVNMTVLKLLNLMLRVWDDGIGLPDWVEDL